VSLQSNSETDLRIVTGRKRGHGPKGSKGEESGILVDATRKTKMMPLALPAREYMENARAIWEELGLPELSPRAPWHGYPMGDWSDLWERFARNAVEGRWAENGVQTLGRRRGGLKPETPTRLAEDDE